MQQVYIPNEQFEKEDFPLAVQLTIHLRSNKSAEKYSLEALPDKAQIELIATAVSEMLNFFKNKLLILKIRKNKIEMIVESPANVEKIANGATLCVIEILRRSRRFSEKINLWQPQVEIQNIWTESRLANAVKKIKTQT